MTGSFRHCLASFLPLGKQIVQRSGGLALLTAEQVRVDAHHERRRGVAKATGDGEHVDAAVQPLEGTIARSRKEADADMRWAGVVVLWGSTPLDHRVSALYKGANVLTVTQRSVQLLAREVGRFAENIRGQAPAQD